MTLKKGDNIKEVTSSSTPRKARADFYGIPYDLRPRLREIYKYHVNREYEEVLRDNNIPFGASIRDWIDSQNSLFWAYAGLGSWEVSPIMYGVIRFAKPKVIVEIGTDLGGFVIVAGTAIKENGLGKMWTIDIEQLQFVKDEYKDTFLQEYELDGDSINFVTADSNNLLMFWDKPIDFLFVDGSKDPVIHQKDLFGYGEFVSPGGWIFVHDYGIEAVKENVNEFAEENNLNIHIGGWRNDPKSWALMIKEG